MSAPTQATTAPAAPNGDGAGPVLAAEGVCVNFGGVAALSEVSIEVRPQTVVGLIGPNGAGKSTLLSVLSGLQRPRQGRVFLNGEEVTAWSAQARARKGMARTFQIPELFAGLTVREHLSLPWRLRFDRSRLWKDMVTARGWRSPPAPERERVGQLLEWLGLAGLANAPVAALPLGYSRLVEVGRALAGGPRVVLLDEPLSGLDSSESEELAATLHRLVQADDVSFLLVDHDVDIVLSKSDHVFVLDFGRLIAEGGAEHIREDAAVRSAYLGGQGHADHGVQP